MPLRFGRKTVVMFGGFLAVLVVVGVLSSRGDAEIPVTDRLEAENAIYPQVIRQALSGYNIEMHWLIREQTEFLELGSSEYVQEHLQDISPDIMHDLVSANSESFQLSSRFDFDYEFLYQDVYEEIFKLDLVGWDEFSARYSGLSGFVTLSRAGFNPEMDRALIYAAASCGLTCGSANLYLFIKKGNHWFLEKIILLSVS